MNSDTQRLEITRDILVAFLSSNTIRTDELSELIKDTFKTVSHLSQNAAINGNAETQQKPAVEIDESLGEDFIICLEDGKKFKSLKRHLMSSYNLSPEAYRRKWGLSPDYPMVAPSYAKRRSELAKEAGLGRKPSAE